MSTAHESSTNQPAPRTKSQPFSGASEKMSKPDIDILFPPSIFIVDKRV